MVWRLGREDRSRSMAAARPLVRAASLLVLPVLVACGEAEPGDTGVRGDSTETSAADDTGTAAPDRCGAVLRDEVTAIVGADLWYVSETDSLVPAVWLPVDGGASVPLDASVVRDAAGIDPAKSPDVRELDAWFRPLVEGWEGMDPVQEADAGRWAALRDWLHAHTRGPAVFRFGEIEIPVVGVGVDRCGDLVGFRTLAVET